MFSRWKILCQLLENKLIVRETHRVFTVSITVAFNEKRPNSMHKLKEILLKYSGQDDACLKLYEGSKTL
jgi:hypothetical protein